MKKDILFEKYAQMNEIALAPKKITLDEFIKYYYPEIEYYFEKFAGEGLDDREAYVKAMNTVIAKYNVEVNEEVEFRANDEDVPDGPY